MKINVCPICGSEFIPKFHYQKYCSPECRNKFNRQNARERQNRGKLKVCSVCGREFFGNKKYCSSDCKRYALSTLHHNWEELSKKAQPCRGLSSDVYVPVSVCLNCKSSRCRYD